MRREPFLIERFESFCRELIRLVRLVESGAETPFDGASSDNGPTAAPSQRLRPTAASEKPPLPEGDEGESEVAPSGIRRRLLRLLKRQALEIGTSRGSAAAELYGQAQYVMAALGDEILLHIQWKGTAQWRSHLLESELFQTHHAGEEIFTRIDQLLLDRDPLRAELAQIYLLALGLGFQGGFRDTELGAQSLAARGESPFEPRARDFSSEQGAKPEEYREYFEDFATQSWRKRPAVGRKEFHHGLLNQYRQRLLELVATWDPELLETAPPLVPEAYTSTLAEGSGARLPYLRPWMLALGGVVVTWILVGHGIWRHLVSEIETLIRAILQ